MNKTIRTEIISDAIKNSEETGGFYLDENTYTINGKNITLQFRILPNQIEIIDKNNPHFQMSSSVKPGLNGRKEISFRIYTSGYGPNEEKHPLMYPSEFFIKCFSYFKRMDNEPDCIKAVWVKHGKMKSVNAVAFQKSDSEDRAFLTWTGKLAYRLGFNIAEVTENNQEIIVYFSKVKSE